MIKIISNNWCLTRGAYLVESGTLLSMEQTDANTTMSSDILVMFFIRFARIPSVHFTLTARTLKHEYLVAVLE